MRLQTFGIAVLMVSVVMVAMASSLTSFTDTYNSAAAPVDLKRFNQIDEVNELVVDIKNDLQDKNTTFTVTDTFNAFVKTGFTSARLILGLLPSIIDIITSTQEVISIDPVVAAGLVTIITALLIFTLISAIFKWRT